MMATAADAMGDMITTSVTILSILIFHFFHLNVDGFIGVIVAAIVMWAGVGIARDTLSPADRCARRSGKPVRPLLIWWKAMTASWEPTISSYTTTDPAGHRFHSRRVPQDADIRASHEIIDKAEREVSQKLNILLVIHMDPIETMTNVSSLSVLRLHEAVHTVDPELSFPRFSYD